MYTYLNPDAISGFTEAQDQYVLTKNGSGFSWTAMTSTDGCVPTGRTINGKNLSTNITLNASDVSALTNTTKYAASIQLSGNSTTFQYTWQLKDQDGNNLGSPQTLDLPMESVVVGGTYIASAKTVQLLLQSGSTIEFSIADLVSGLQTTLSSSNKLNADYIQDGTTNKVYTATEKTKLSGIETGAQKNGDAYKTIQINNSTANLSAGNSGDTFTISAGTNIQLTAASKKVTISATDTKPGKLITTATTTQSTSTGETMENNITLHKVSKTGSYGDLLNKPTNLSEFTNDLNFINSGVTALTNFATSANVVNALNEKATRDELPLQIMLPLQRYSTTVTGYTDYYNMQQISVRDIVDILDKYRTVEIYAYPASMIGGMMKRSKLDNIQFGIAYQMPGTGRTYFIKGDCFVDFYNKQYEFQATDDTTNASPNYVWSASVITNPDDYITSSDMKTYVTTTDSTIIFYASDGINYDIGTGGGKIGYLNDVSKGIYELVNGTNPSKKNCNALFNFYDLSANTRIIMHCTNQTVETGTDYTGFTYSFKSDLVYIQSVNYYYEYSATVTYSAITYGGDISGMVPNFNLQYTQVFPKLPEPFDFYSGQTLTVSSAGTYELTEATDCIGSGITHLDYCDYSYIFGLQCLSSDTIATLLYIDDFPSNVISAIEAASGTLQNHIDAISNDFAYAIDCGTNICSITPETIEYDGETYRLWRFCTLNYIGVIEEIRWFGLMSDDIDAQYLIDNSMESDITKRFCPFVAVGYFDEVNVNDFNVAYPQNDHHFSLICVKTDDVFTQPTPTPNQLITDMYIDSLYRYPLPLVYNNALSDGYLTGVTDNTVSELLTYSYALYENTSMHFKLVDSVIISGNTYSMWINNGGSGSIIGLTTPGLTFEDVFPQTIEGNLENIKLNNNPFVYMSTNINDLTTYAANDIQEDSRYTTIIRVR